MTKTTTSVRHLRRKRLKNTESHWFAGNVSAGEAKKLKNKLRKQQMREQQEKQKQIEADRRKKESHRHRAKDDGEDEKVKEDEIVAEKLDHVNDVHSPSFSKTNIFFPAGKTTRRRNEVLTTIGRFFGQFDSDSLSRVRSVLSTKWVEYDIQRLMNDRTVLFCRKASIDVTVFETNEQIGS